MKQCFNLILFSLITLWQTVKKTHLFYDKVGFPRALASRRAGPRIETSILHIHQLRAQCEEHLVSVIKNNSSVDYWSTKGQHKKNVSAPIFLPSTIFVKYSNEVSLSNNNCFFMEKLDYGYCISCMLIGSGRMVRAPNPQLCDHIRSIKWSLRKLTTLNLYLKRQDFARCKIAHPPYMLRFFNKSLMS